MILQQIWFMIAAGSILYAMLLGKAAQILPALLAGCENALSLTFQLGAGYLLFCGLLEIAREAGVHRGLERIIRPIMRWLTPHVREKETHQAVALNLSMNMLGLGNAATPLGMEAVRRMDAEAAHCPGARQDLYMLLVLNATSIQLFPTTVLTLRRAAGSADVNAVLVPTLLCTVISTAVGAGLAMLCQKWGKGAC